MGKYDRGVYEPSDEVRAFDGAEDEDDVEGSRLPLLIVLALLVLAMFAGVVWLAYTQGVARGRGDTPVLTAASGPERVAPPAAASGTVPYQGFKIYEQQAPSDDAAADGPAPKPAPVAVAPAALKPVPVAAPTAPKVTAMTPPPVAKPAPAPAKPVPAAPPAKSVAGLIQQPSSVPTKPAAAPLKPTAAPPKPASAPPAAKQAAAPPSVATGAPRQLGMAVVPPPAAPKVAAAPVPSAAKSAGDGFVLQIGAYKSQADAETAWRTYKGRHAALLSGYSENIQQADLGDRGTWYRLRIGGLSDREVAAALCERLKADGAACILGR